MPRVYEQRRHGRVCRPCLQPVLVPTSEGETAFLHETAGCLPPRKAHGEDVDRQPSIYGLWCRALLIGRALAPGRRHRNHTDPFSRRSPVPQSIKLVDGAPGFRAGRSSNWCSAGSATRLIAPAGSCITLSRQILPLLPLALNDSIKPRSGGRHERP